MKVFESDMKIKKEENGLNFDPSFINKYKNKLRVIYDNKIYPLNHKFSNNNKELKINLISLEQLPIYDIHNIRYIKEDDETDLWDRYEEEEEDDQIRLFGKKFVEWNKDKCLIIYNDEIYPLQEYFLIKDIESKNVKIKLLIFEKIISLSYLFDKCKSLTEIEFFESNTKIFNKNFENNLKNETIFLNVNDSEYSEFYKSNEEIDFYPSKTNKSLTVNDYYTIIKEKYNGTISSLYSYNKLFNIKNIYIKSKSIIYLPKITYMSYMFRYCSSLKSLPDDITKIDTKNVKYIFGIFYRCSSLISLPDISKWNTNNVSDISYMFYECSSLLSLPDISKWNIDNVIYMDYMFSYCSSLTSLPDISKWNINKVTDISFIFRNCSRLISLPDISKWNINNVTKMSCMFCGCSSLLSLPDLSKWDTNNVTEIGGIFDGCSSLISLPDISK